MDWERFLVWGDAFEPLWWAWLDPELVVLSIGIAVAAAVMALQLAQLARDSAAGWVRNVVIGSGALSLGGGIWAMHFVGMLAFAPCASGGFGLAMTVLSALPSVAASWLAFHTMLQPQVGRARKVLSGTWLGLGIVCMHFMGMAASEAAPMIRYDLRWVLVALFAALGLAIAAVFLFVRMGERSHRRWQATLAAGSVLGLAISSMHYTAMGAIRLEVPAQAVGLHLVTNNALLIMGIVGVGGLLSMLVILVNLLLRYRHQLQEAARSESRLRAVVNASLDAVVMADARGCIQSFNGAAERLLGWTEAEVRGRDISLIVDPAYRSTPHLYLPQDLVPGEARRIGEDKNLYASHKDGRLVPIRLVVGRIDQPGSPTYVGFLADQSERHAAEQQRRLGQEQLRSLVGNIPGVAFRSRNTPDWPMLFISDAIEGLTGWPAQDFLDGRVHMGRLLHADDLARVEHAVDEALERGDSYHVEYRLHTRDGGLRWVSETGRGAPGPEGWVEWIDGVIVDMTAAKARNAEFEGTVHAIGRSQAVIEFDLQGRVLTANANFLALMGYTLDEVLGQHHAMFCTPALVASDQYRKFWERLGRGEFDAGEYLRLGKGGREVWIQATYNPIFDADGRAFKIVKFATDLTERRAMEQDLRAAKERAEQAAAARSTFLANMSHEIRTPMNAIIGFTEALRETELQPAQARYLGTVHHAARSMLRLLNDILDTAKLDKGAMELEVANFAPRELCRQVLISLRIAADKKGLPLRLEYADSVPAYLRGDALRVQQILVNLLGNAIKFTEHGHVALAVGYDQGWLQLEVSDTGIGIAPDKIEHIFAPFAQADASTTRRFGGTGLGTTISRQLAELMGGHIRASSSLGAGTQFVVALPLPPGQAPQQAEAVGRLRLPPLRILAVDDVEDNLELLNIQLSKDGHHLVLVDSGAQALDLFCEQPPEMVLMDLQMPGMDGLETTRAMRAWEAERQRSPVPIIALSASVLEQDRQAARAAGMDGFAAKPLEMEQLRSEMARVLDLQTVLQLAKPPPPATPLEDEGLAVDWGVGLSLWGSLAQHKAALHRFVQQQRDVPAQLRQAHADGDWPQVGSLAHRLRGAAGNLALPMLYELLSALEIAARGSEADRGAGLIAQLPGALAAVQRAVQQHGHARPAAAPVAAAAPAEEHRAEVLASLQRLAQALAQGELDTQAQLWLAQALPADEGEPLQQALDAFDFEAAQACVQQLQAAWSPTA